MQRWRTAALLTAMVVALGVGCSGGTGENGRTGSGGGDGGGGGGGSDRGRSTTTVAPPPETVLAVGDIAACDRTDDEAVAAMVASRSGPVLLLGDLVYPGGTPEAFAECFEPAWGPMRSRLRPTPGNHDYYVREAAGYFDYFTAAGVPVGERGQGWYSFDVGPWHVVALNSNCAAVGGCQAGSEQEQWLRADLASATAARCTLAFWHHARFSSGGAHGSDPVTGDLWRALADAGAEVVLVGHEHNYERFAPLDPAGNVDARRGIRQFVVGTGGRSHYGFEAPHPGSLVRDGTTFGVLELTLHADRYAWRFLSVAGGELTDAGEDRCR